MSENMLKNDDFFNVGYGEINNDLDRQKKNREQMDQKGLREFWMKAGEKDAVIRFLTEEPISFYRHSIYFNGRWNKYSCTGNPETCPMCKAEVPRSVHGAHLVIDRREFSGKDDKVYRNEIKIMCFVSKHIKRFQNQAEKAAQQRAAAGEKDDPKRILRREWSVERDGAGQGTVYDIYPLVTKAIPDDEKEKYKAVFAKYAPAWKEYQTRRNKELPVERYIVAVHVSPLSLEELQRIVDEKYNKKDNKETAHEKAEEQEDAKATGSSESDESDFDL